MLDAPLPISADDDARRERYVEVRLRIEALLEGEDDWVSAMATVVCELHHAFDYFDWTGFYRHARPGWLHVGPYQGGHGCLRIAFDRGVCGAAARERRTQRVDDVNAFEGHIACATSTRSELVVPVVTPQGRLLAVLDVDSDAEAAFHEVDARAIESLCALLAERFADHALAEDEPLTR